MTKYEQQHIENHATMATAIQEMSGDVGQLSDMVVRLTGITDKLLERITALENDRASVAEILCRRHEPGD